MFEAVKQWWEEKDGSQKRHLEEALSREGVRNGKNHEGEDSNPGRRCGHSYKGMPEGGSVASHSSGNQQLCSGGDESSGSSYGGCYKESSRVAPSRNREEPSSYGNTSGVYGSSCNNNESSSYNQSNGRHSDNLQQSSYGSGSNRQEASPLWR